MFSKSFLSAIVIFSILAPSQAIGAWTEWVNLANRKEVNDLVSRMEHRNGQRLVTKRVRCKAENNTIYISFDYRSVHTGGIFYFDAGYWKNLQASDKELKRRGAHVISRSDIDTNRGKFTCIVWHKPQW
jgi:hypothetical protein